MKKMLIVISVIMAIAAGAALHWLPADLLSGEKEPADTENPVPQEPDIRTETLPEETHTTELEQEPGSDTQIGQEPVAAAIPESSLIADVPFTVQAPFGEWDDPIFQNACEEASIIMAAYFLSGKPLTREEAKKEIVALARFEDKWFGHSIDTSAEDTLKLFEDYYGIASGEVRKDITLLDIRTALASGSLVIVPADGRKLHNPHFIQPGPTRHMLVITGYDAVKKEFITNDPGTKYGEGYRYGEDVLYGAILDYPTGDHLPIRVPGTAMIVVSKL